LLGITAGEAENPRPTIVKAVKDTVGRILIFYVGAIFVIVSIYPWNQLSAIGSPFVQTFSKIGITFAAALINFVVITAALSGANSGIYSASRMLYTLAEEKQLPKKFKLLNRHGVPLYPVLLVGLGIGLGVLLNALLPLIAPAAGNVFVMVYSSSVLPGMVPWVVILVSETQFRKVHEDKMAAHPFKMPGAPYTNYLTLAFLALTLVFMIMNPETRISLGIGVIYLAIMTTIYFKKHHHRAA
jgi:AAT family amino acid transporter